MPDTHSIPPLIELFNAQFMPLHNTELVCCEPDPIYRPANGNHPNQIVFAHGFFASALHEIAHWCIAGKERRLLEDFGYWYQPDGRDAAKQAEFEKVEIKPQALEWIFSVSAGVPFIFSADNIALGNSVSDTFKQAVHAQVANYLANGLPIDASIWSATLIKHYQPDLTQSALCLADFTLD